MTTSNLDVKMSTYMKVREEQWCPMCDETSTRWVKMSPIICNNCNDQSPVHNNGFEKKLFSKWIAMVLDGGYDGFIAPQQIVVDGKLTEKAKVVKAIWPGL